jgi:hypothetical protein
VLLLHAGFLRSRAEESRNGRAAGPLSPPTAIDVDNRRQGHDDLEGGQHGYVALQAAIERHGDG